MRMPRVALNLVIVGIVIVGAIVVGENLRQARTRAPSGAEATARSAAAAPVSAATPMPSPGNCTKFGAIQPRVAPSLASSDEANGTQRFTSAEGGYSIVLPASWRVVPSVFGSGFTAYGQLHATSYDPQAVPAPDPERMMLPPSVGISLDIQVWMNSEHLALEKFADNVHIGPDQFARRPGTSLTVGGRAAFRLTINDEHRFQPADRPLVVTRQTRIVWLIQGVERERVFVIYATPGESNLLAVVERAVADMSFRASFASQRRVVHQRDEILNRWLFDKTGPIAGRRAEAKLMTYAEAHAAMNDVPPGGPKPIQLLRLDHDPNDLYWLVAVSGPGLPAMRSGPPGRGATQTTPPATAWILYNTSATDDSDVASTGMRASSQGSWPPGFDALPDRCR
jgi:hypothetical protein